jgi:hypothetical protein
MKRIMTVGLLCAISTANAAILLNIYESDGLTAFNGRHVTVGTSLKLVIISDANDFWAGGLFLQGSNRNLGILSGIDLDPQSRDYAGSHEISAGPEATVTRWEDSEVEGFDLISDVNCISGNWFEIDYRALAPGDPHIRFYDYNLSWDDPNCLVTIHQVPAADYNLDGVVNLLDFAPLSSCWQQMNCDPKADLDSDGLVALNDLLWFIDYWLWTGQEPNEPSARIAQAESKLDIPTPDPNLLYQIVDSLGQDEITIHVGQTVTLYVDMLTRDTDRVWLFAVETDISDPNLGTLDNTAYDPNNPPGPGTARILAGPNRWTWFDRWEPGILQLEGIYLSGVSEGNAFEDGHLASFEFTCRGIGDVALELINLETISITGDPLYPTVKGILIHQIDPTASITASAQLMMDSTAPTSWDYETASLDSEISLTDTESTVSITTASSTEDLALFLEELWLTDPSIRDMFSQEDWQTFVESVEQSE